MIKKFGLNEFKCVSKTDYVHLASLMTTSMIVYHIRMQTCFTHNLRPFSCINTEQSRIFITVQISGNDSLFETFANLVEYLMTRYGHF